MDIGEKVALLRELHGWTQEELARRIGGKVKQQNIQQLEAGVVSQPRYLKKLAAVLHITYDALLSDAPLNVDGSFSGAPPDKPILSEGPAANIEEPDEEYNAEPIRFRVPGTSKFTNIKPRFSKSLTPQNMTLWRKVKLMEESDRFTDQDKHLIEQLLDRISDKQ